MVYSFSNCQEAGIGNLESGLQIYLSMFICLRILLLPGIHKYVVEKSCLLERKYHAYFVFLWILLTPKSKGLYPLRLCLIFFVFTH